jgi:hypothetical protein
MIEFQQATKQIRQDEKSSLEIVAVNTSKGACLNIFFHIDLPFGMNVYEGECYIEIHRLSAGEKYPIPLVVQATRPGSFAVCVEDVSYYGPDNRVYTPENIQFSLDVLPGTNNLPAGPAWAIRLYPHELTVDQWDRIHANIKNNTTRDWKNVKMRSQPGGLWEIDPFILESIAPGESKDVEFAACPKSAGNSVPVKVELVSVSGNVLHTEKLFLKVLFAREQGTSKPGPETVYHVTIKDGQGTVIGSGAQMEQHFESPVADSGDETVDRKE